jgi:hypothetical protein
VSAFGPGVAQSWPLSTPSFGIARNAHPDRICRNVAEELLQIARRIPALHAAMDAANANELTGFVRFAERPGAGLFNPLDSRLTSGDLVLPNCYL